MKNLSGVKSNQRGFTVIEFIMVLSAVIAIIGFVVSLFRDGLDASDKMQASMLHSTLVQKVQDAYDPQNNCAGISAAQVAAIKAAPAQMITGNSITDAYGNPVTFAAVTISSANDHFTTTYTNVTPEICASFAQAIETAHPRLDISGSVVKNTYASIPYSVALVSTACSGNGNKSITAYTRCR